MYDRQIFVKQLLKILRLQLVLGLGISIVFWFIRRDLTIFISALIGCSVGFVPSVVSALLILRGKFVSSAGVVLRKHKRALLWRFVTTIIMFLIVYKFSVHLNLWALFISYIVTLNCYWLALAI